MDHTDLWKSANNPWPNQCHHILPVTCFRFKNLPKDKKYYLRRCLWVSKWNINGGKRHPQTPKKDNNMLMLPTLRAYKNRYPATPGPITAKKYPVNLPVHDSTYSEHHLYTLELRDHLKRKIWDKLQEDKKKHKGKGEDILSRLRSAQSKFRGELEKRGDRRTKKGNQGSKECWDVRKSDPQWPLTFSMATEKKGKAWTSKHA